MRTRLLPNGTVVTWEEGGARGAAPDRISRGAALVLAGASGEPATPVAFPREPSPLGRHATVALQPGMHAIRVTAVRGVIAHINAYRIDIRQGDARLEPLAHFRNGSWRASPPEFLRSAIDAAVAKACHHHCSEAYWVRGAARLRKTSPTR